MKSKSEKSKKKPAKRKSTFWRMVKYTFWAGLFYTVWSCWDIYKVGHTDEGSKADCAIVLGAAAWHTKPSPVFAARLDHAIGLYKSGRVTRLLLTGGKGKGAPFAESEVGRDYCISKGVPAGHIVIEIVSLNTFENVQQAVELCNKNQYSSCLLVSDPWHLKRAILMGEQAGLLVKASATTTSKYESFSSQSSFLAREWLHVQVFRLFGR